VASIVSNQTAPGFSAPAGWTVVEDDAIPNTLRQTIYVKVAGPSEPASYTWTLAGPRQVTGGITTYAGVDTSHPVDAHAATVTPGAGTAVTAPSITTTVAGAKVVDFSAVNAEGIITAPGGMTERWLAASPTGGTTDALAASFDATQSRPGPTGPRTATATESQGGRIAAVVALRPGR
jgi:hypothetical protein